MCEYSVKFGPSLVAVCVIKQNFMNSTFEIT